MIKHLNWSSIDEKRNLSLFISVVTFLLIFIMAARTPLDTDFWWHIKAGEQSILSGKPMLVDTFTFSRGGADWINHSWLAEVILYLVYHWGGYLGTGLLVAVLASANLMILYPLMKSHPLMRSVFLILAAIVASWIWSPRPQLFTLCLFSLCIYILILYRETRSKIIWVLPVLFMFWSNLHGGYTLGFILIGAYILGEIINKGLGERGYGNLSWRDVERVVVVTVLSGLAVIINPNGVEMWLIPFKTVNVKVLQQFIDEWASPNFHEIAMQPFLWLLFSCFAVIGFSNKRADAYDVAGLIGFGMMALISKRNYGPFALFAVMSFDKYWVSAWTEVKNSSPFYEWIVRFKERIGKNPARPIAIKVRNWINLMIVFILGLVAASKLIIVTYPVYVESNIEKYYPVGAINWLKNQNASGNLMSSYGWGGYLVWTHPEQRVFVDGRTDLFGDEIIGEWIQVMNGEPGWQKILDQYDVEWILIEPERPIAKLLPQENWIEVYRDSISVVFKPNR